MQSAYICKIGVGKKIQRSYVGIKSVDVEEVRIMRIYECGVSCLEISMYRKNLLLSVFQSVTLNLPAVFLFLLAVLHVLKTVFLGGKVWFFEIFLFCLRFLFFFSSEHS